MHARMSTHPMGPVQRAQQAEVRRILRSIGAQAKLNIGQPNDKYEREAHRVADQVMAMPDKTAVRDQGRGVSNGNNTIQMKPT
jgi:hypothetical protein